MWPIFIQTIKDKKFFILLFCLISVSFMALYTFMMPSIAQQAEQLSQLTDAYPKQFLQAFGLEDITQVFSSFEGFLATEQFSITWPLMIIIMATALASGAIAGEIEKGTIELLLSQPVSRTKILLAKYFAGAFILLIFTLLSNYSGVAFAKIANIDFNLEAFNNVSLIGYFFGLTFYSLSFVFSTIFSERGKVTMLTGGIAIIMYVLQLLSRFNQDFENVKYASLFHYFDPNQLMIDLKLDLNSIIVLSITSIIGLLISLIIFNRRDVAV